MTIPDVWNNRTYWAARTSQWLVSKNFYQRFTFFIVLNHWNLKPCTMNLDLLQSWKGTTIIFLKGTKSLTLVINLNASCDFHILEKTTWIQSSPQGAFTNLKQFLLERFPLFPPPSLPSPRVARVVASHEKHRPKRCLPVFPEMDKPLIPESQ